MEDIRKVVAFDSVEEFWGLYNNIVPPSQLPGKANYYLFKVGRSGRISMEELTLGQHHASLGGYCEQARWKVGNPSSPRQDKERN